MNSTMKLVKKPRVLVLLGCYLPGFRSGGPVRTISSMVEALSAHFEFHIVTLNHDSGSDVPYDSVKTGAWNQVGSARVYYVPKWSLKIIRTIAEEVNPDVIYLNGFFATSTLFGLIARKLKMLPRAPLVLATRGDLAGGALGLKSSKKQTFMFFARKLGLYDELLWHASSVREKREMVEQLNDFGVVEDSVHVASDLGQGYAEIVNTPKQKAPGEAHFVTVSRVTRMKNLSFTLDRLSELEGRISLEIFGPIEDQELWAECGQKIRELPPSVAVQYRGELEPSSVVSEMSKRHFFILPTLGENYGHVIIEGAAAGCPLVISNRTQWLSLSQKGIGWDIPLDDLSRWKNVLQECVDMTDERYRRMSEAAKEFGRAVMNSPENLDANIELFRRAAGEVATHNLRMSGAAR